MEQLNLDKTIKVLNKYGLKFVDYKIIKSEKDLEKIKFPVVMKVSSEKIVHKSDKGGVIVGIKNKDNAFSAFEKLRNISKDIIIQKMISGKEVIIGMKKDSQFGPVIMFGLGGIFVEVLKDVSFRVCPVSKDDAISMMKEIKMYKVLEGFRGEKGVNVNAIADIIVKISNLSLKENINEIDLNPVMANEKEAVIVDARFMI
jgi:acetyl-CoA synthetase (ADP-forming)